jgi:hypothetical protein
MVHKKLSKKSKPLKRGIHKYNYDGFSKAFNKKGEVVAWVGTFTYSGKEPKFAENIKEYIISFWVGEVDEGHIEEMTVHATDLDALKTALGYYSDYAREWGDYRGIIKGMDDKTVTIHELKRDYKKVGY